MLPSAAVQARPRRPVRPVKQGPNDVYCLVRTNTFLPGPGTWPQQKEKTKVYSTRSLSFGANLKSLKTGKGIRQSEEEMKGPKSRDDLLWSLYGVGPLVRRAILGAVFGVAWSFAKKVRSASRAPASKQRVTNCRLAEGPIGLSILTGQGLLIRLAFGAEVSGGASPGGPSSGLRRSKVSSCIRIGTTRLSARVLEVEVKLIQGSSAALR